MKEPINFSEFKLDISKIAEPNDFKANSGLLEELPFNAYSIFRHYLLKGYTIEAAFSRSFIQAKFR